MKDKTGEADRVWTKSMPANSKTAFLCCFAAGYITHLYAFTNIIPNPDGLSRIADPQQMTISGRWFLHYATMWNGYVQSPAVIGFFSVLFLSLAAALTVSLLEIRSPFLSGIAGVLMIVFPPVAGTYLYMYTASAYIFGILLAVLSVWVSSRYKYGFLPAALLLACAVGTYQAYFAVAVSLSVISVLLYALENGREGKESFLYGVRLLVHLILGLALYLGILKVFLRVKDLTLIDYKGISSMTGMLRPDALLPQIIPAYRTFFSYFFRPGGASSYATGFSTALNLALFILAAVSFLLVSCQNCLLKRRGPAVIAVCMAVLLPAALNVSFFMGDTKDILR